MGSPSEFVTLLTDNVTLAVIVALILGKTVGVTVATRIVTWFPGVNLPKGAKWIDFIGVALLAGIGFTVSLLIGELSFGQESMLGNEAKIGILFGSLGAAVLAALLLSSRNRRYRRQLREEAADRNRDGIPDQFQTPETQS